MDKLRSGFSVLLIALLVVVTTSAQNSPRRTRMPQLSTAALFSGAAHHNNLGAVDLGKLQRNEVQQERSSTLGALSAAVSSSPASTASPGRFQANADWNGRPQDETTIAINPLTGQWLIGANDYGIGTPIGTGVYTSEGINYFPPFPLLFDTDFGIAEPPVGTGDPALAYGYTRDTHVPVAYMASVGFSATFGENGVFLYRSLDNGKNWTRPVVPPLAPPNGLRTVAYWPHASDFSIIHDKEYVAVDNSGGPHDGRVYVTWTLFQFDVNTGSFLNAPIVMAYSDDNGDTFSSPLEISGSSASLCPVPSPGGPANACNNDQFSSPVVLPDGTLVVGFENGNPASAPEDQYLTVRVNPDTFVVQGPFKVSDVFDGPNDYPINSDGRQTLCNSNFRVNSVGNIASGPGGVLYAVIADDRQHAGQFPFPTFVGNRQSGYACPNGLMTDVDVLLSKSSDGGFSWSTLVRVNQDPSADNKDQWFPWVAVNRQGRVGVVFFDRRRDAGNKIARTFLALSHDGGAHFRDFEVSRFGSNFDNAFFGGGNFIGDYNGMAVKLSGEFVPVWTGVSPGKMDSDIFFASAGEE
jgi:hypothetical protein